MSSAQDWCLNCGAAATTHIAAPPAWRGPLVAMLGVLLLALAALILAFFALADDDPPTTPAASPTPTPALVDPMPTPAGGETPNPSPDAQAPARWPEGETAWTIVLDSSTSEEAAARRAERLQAEGITAGVLRSDEFRSLGRGTWLVFSGQYESSRAAARAQRELTGAPPSAYVRRITPR